MKGKGKDDKGLNERESGITRATPFSFVPLELCYSSPPTKQPEGMETDREEDKGNDKVGKHGQVERERVTKAVQKPPCHIARTLT